MYEYIKGLSVTLCLLSEKTEDKAFSNVFKSESLDLLKKSHVFLNLDMSNNFELIAFRNYCIQLLSLLDLARITKKISHMNALVITDSLLNFLKELDKKISHAGAFSQTLFHLKELDQSLFRVLAKNNLTATASSSKAGFGFSKIPTFSEDSSLEKNSDIGESEVTVGVAENETSKNHLNTVPPNHESTGSLVYTTFGDTEQKHIEERRTKILTLLKTGGGNIRDMAKNFPGVNEKTLQRDLIELMREKRVIMLGKKRWAKYYLK